MPRRPQESNPDPRQALPREEVAQRADLPVVAEVNQNLSKRAALQEDKAEQKLQARLKLVTKSPPSLLQPNQEAAQEEKLQLPRERNLLQDVAPNQRESNQLLSHQQANPKESPEASPREDLKAEESLKEDLQENPMFKLMLLKLLQLKKRHPSPREEALQEERALERDLLPKQDDQPLKERDQLQRQEDQLLKERHQLPRAEKNPPQKDQLQKVPAREDQPPKERDQLLKQEDQLLRERDQLPNQEDQPLRENNQLLSHQQANPEEANQDLNPRERWKLKVERRALEELQDQSLRELLKNHPNQSPNLNPSLSLSPSPREELARERQVRLVKILA